MKVFHLTTQVYRFCNLWLNIFLLCLSMTSSVRVVQQQERSLVYPPGSTHKIQIIFGFGIPVPELEDNISVVLGTSIKLSWDVPNNASQWRNRKKRGMSGSDAGTKKLMSRWELYALLEQAGTSLGFHGRACLLKNICDIASAPFHHNSILGELFHIILTPSKMYEKHRTSINDNEYLDAERVGKSGRLCAHAYPECKAGILDLVTTMF